MTIVIFTIITLEIRTRLIRLKYYDNTRKSLALLCSKIITLEIINFAVLQQNIGNSSSTVLQDYHIRISRSTPPFQLPIDRMQETKNQINTLIKRILINNFTQQIKLSNNTIAH